MLRILRAWPLAVAAFMFPFTVEWIMPPLWACGIRDWRFVALSVVVATTEPVFWFWFFTRWWPRWTHERRIIQEAWRQFCEFGLNEQARQFFGSAGSWLERFVRRHLERSSRLKRWFVDLMLSLFHRDSIRFSYFSLFGLAFIPYGYFAAIRACHVRRIPGGFTVHLVANAIKIGAYAYLISQGVQIGWQFVLQFFR